MTTIQIDAETKGGDADVQADPAMGTSVLPGRDALDRQTLQDLSRKSDRAGLLHLAGHLLVIAASAGAVYATGDALWLKVQVMVFLGFAIDTLFAPMHECVHGTPFASRRLNRIVGWLTGAAIGWNATYYRRFHAWHHRYTQDPDNDPELMTPKPRTTWDYVMRLSGLPYYRDQMKILLRCAFGAIGGQPFIPARGIGEIQRSALLQLSLYGAVAAASVYYESWIAVTYWLLPMVMAQPFMRFMLLAEHTGCSEDRNGLTNTRTTYCTRPARFLMWNMPFHAEHHLYPSVPFHALPKVHEAVKSRLAHISADYKAAHEEIREDMKSARNAPA